MQPSLFLILGARRYTSSEQGWRGWKRLGWCVGGPAGWPCRPAWPEKDGLDGVSARSEQRTVTGLTHPPSQRALCHCLPGWLPFAHQTHTRPPVAPHAIRRIGRGLSAKRIWVGGGAQVCFGGCYEGRGCAEPAKQEAECHQASDVRANRGAHPVTAIPLSLSVWQRAVGAGNTHGQKGRTAGCGKRVRSLSQASTEHRRYHAHKAGVPGRVSCPRQDAYCGSCSLLDVAREGRSEVMLRSSFPPEDP
jgi:hypothetical protein